MQSGKAKTCKWLMVFEGAFPSRKDPITGWVAGDNTLEEVHLEFDTLEEAIHFAQKEKYTYTIQDVHTVKFKPKCYADNFRFDRPLA